MKVQLYQIIVLVISSVMLFQGGRNFLKRESGQTLLKLMVRIVVWGGMGLIAIFPNLTEVVAKVFGFRENINAVIIIGFLFVFMIIFKLLSAIEKIEQNVSELTRRDALADLSLADKERDTD